VDEGGVSKEFYQLVTGQLFNPDYGAWVSVICGDKTTYLMCNLDHEIPKIEHAI